MRWSGILRNGLRLAAGALLTGAAASSWAGTEQLLDVARVWSQARATHPALADGRIDWDKALVDTLPGFLAAEDATAFSATLQKLMAPLADPAFRVLPQEHPDWAQPPRDKLAFAWLPGHTAWVRLQPGSAVAPLGPEALAGARRVIIDVRPVGPADFDRAGWEQALHGLISRLIARPLTLPAERYRFTSGPRAAAPAQWEGLPNGFIMLEASRIMPSANARSRPLAFIVNETEPVPKAIVALQREGLAVVVSEEAAWRSRSGPLHTVWLSNGLRAEFSVGELVSSGGAVGFSADLALPKDRSSGPGGAVVRATLALMDRPLSRAAAKAPTVAAFPVRHDDSPYRDMVFPNRSWRMLSAIKLWATMDKYFPSKHLMSSSWDDALLTCLARQDTATNAFDYAAALETMAAALDDSHVKVFSRALRERRGNAGLGVRLAHLDGRFVVAGFYDAALEQTGRLHVGDEVLLLDGKDVKDLVAALLPRLAASTEAARVRDAMSVLFQGPSGSAVTLTVDDGRGSVRDVAFQRTVMSEAAPMRPAEPIVRKLTADIGYVDLDRLLPEAVPAMFDSMKDTSAIIFDMRGYPHGTARAIARRLNAGKSTLGTSSFQNLVLAHPQHPELQLVYADRLFPPRASLYRGKVVVLINEHAQSQAEHLALLFEAAAPATFVGTPSAGANGDIRNVTLPGGVFISYSGFEVRHANGGQLQGLGVQPHIAVAPTIAGLRAGRDEVLDRAMEFLSKHLDGDAARQ